MGLRRFRQSIGQIRSNVTVVLYHHISENIDPLTSQLDVSILPELFAEHISYFKRNYDIIGVNDLLSSKLPRNPLLITFDDAYRSVLDFGGPILRAANAPAIFFLNPATVISNCVPIDNALSFAVAQLGIDRVLRLLELPPGGISSMRALSAKIIATLKLSDVSTIKHRIFAEFDATEAEICRSYKLFLSLPDVTSLGKYGIDIGNHSMHHLLFRGLADPELDVEIAESRELLERISGRSVNCLSIPYGSEIDATKSVLAVARSSGHQAIFLVHARSNRFRPAEHIYYRVDPRNVPTRALARRLHFDPMLRTIRDLNRSRRIWGSLPEQRGIYY
jgi:peptidoglycan/xylan/chitin deacetylase (PgdA/CDA1 family)